MVKFDDHVFHDLEMARFFFLLWGAAEEAILLSNTYVHIFVMIMFSMILR